MEMRTLGERSYQSYGHGQAYIIGCFQEVLTIVPVHDIALIWAERHVLRITLVMPYRRGR